MVTRSTAERRAAKLARSTRAGPAWCRSSPSHLAFVRGHVRSCPTAADLRTQATRRPLAEVQTRVKPTDRLELRTLAFALLASLLLWNLPFGGVLLYPFKLLATWLHELSHGLAMILTGVGFDHVTIYRDTSGIASGSSEAGGIGR